MYECFELRYNVIEKTKYDVFSLPPEYALCVKKTSTCIDMGSCVHKRIFKCKEMMGLIGAGNNPMVGMTVACAVAVSEAK